MIRAFILGVGFGALALAVVSAWSDPVTRTPFGKVVGHGF